MMTTGPNEGTTQQSSRDLPGTEEQQQLRRRRRRRNKKRLKLSLARFLTITATECCVRFTWRAQNMAQRRNSNLMAKLLVALRNNMGSPLRRGPSNRGESEFKQYPLDANLSSGLLSTVTFGPVERMLPFAHPLSLSPLTSLSRSLSLFLFLFWRQQKKLEKEEMGKEWCENQSRGDYVNVVELLGKQS